jgi:iron complex outermembrane recepter protein
MTSSTARSAVASAIAMALGLALAPSAFAQVQAQASGASADQLQEVVVTAEKRTSTVQNTGASITAVSSEEIADRGIVDFNALATSVPGISMRSSGPGQTEFEMRGLNSAGGNSSQVGFYLDESPLSSPAAAQIGKVEIDPGLYDLQRVEVLRGPQGTLYGSSSMGGAVKLVLNQPQLGTFAASGEVDTGYTGSGGDFNQKVNGMVNLPIGDTLAVRFVGSEISDSGWIKRIVLADGAPIDSGSYANENNERPANFYTYPDSEVINGANSTTIDSARILVLWKPMDNLSITPMLMYQLTRQAAPDEVDVNGNPTHPTTPSTLAHWEIYDSPEPQEDKFTLGSLKIEYQAPGFTVTSATAMWGRNILVSQDSTEENNDAFGFPQYDFSTSATSPGIGPSGPAPNGPSVTEKDYTRQISEELRLTSTGSGPLQWIVGYFYQDLYSEWDEWAIAPQAAPILGTTNLYVDVQPQVIVQNAQFGELSWDFTPELKGTVGLRHYHYSTGQSNEEYGVFTVNGNDTPYNTGFSNSASGTDPKFDLSWKVDPDVLLYATIAKGFRLGGANQPIPVAPLSSCPPPSAAGPIQGNEYSLQLKLTNTCNTALLLQAPGTFTSDSVWNYEIGEKSELLDKHLILNVSAYYERWTNPQISTNLAGFGITANGADARIYGLEAEMQALLSREWTFGVNAGYTNAQFTADSPITGFPNGYNVPDIPDFTASATLRWKHPLTSEVSLVGTLEGDYVGTRTDAPYGETLTLENINTFLLHLPAYEFLNARLGFAANQWTASLYVNNLTNKQALLDPQPQIDLQTTAFVRYLVSRPITAGLDFTYKF